MQRVSEYAPLPKSGKAIPSPSGDLGAGPISPAPQERLPPVSNVAPSQLDPVALSRVTGPAVGRIGDSSAAALDVIASNIVLEAQAGAERLLRESQEQAKLMVDRAESLATGLRQFSDDIREFSRVKSNQIASFCSVAHSILTTSEALAADFIDKARADVTESQEQDPESFKMPMFKNGK